MKKHSMIPRLVLSGALVLASAAATLSQQRPAENFPPKKTKAAKKEKTAVVPHEYPKMGSIERLDPALDALIPPGAQIEKLAEGFAWSEGPVWDPRNDCLLFSDVPNNVVFKWKEGVGTREFLLPSGYTGTDPAGGQGSNGLTLDVGGRLLLCEHGDRRVARLEKDGTKTTLAEYYLFRRLNSPNDLVLDAEGNLYFTDPPYGLKGGDAAPDKELMFSGVYRLSRYGKLTLLTKELSRPNGIALSPDDRTLYVNNSDPARPIIMAYDLALDGTISNGRVFFDTRPLAADQTRKGLPDGLRVDKLGNVFTTGPGGVLVVSPEGKHLGSILTGQATANCAFGGDDGSTLYMTAHMILCRVKTSTKGKGF
jgi:gluconolactonase